MFCVLWLIVFVLLFGLWLLVVCCLLLFIWYLVVNVLFWDGFGFNCCLFVGLVLLIGLVCLKFLGWVCVGLFGVCLRDLLLVVFCLLGVCLFGMYGFVVGLGVCLLLVGCLVGILVLVAG